MKKVRKKVFMYVSVREIERVRERGKEKNTPKNI